MGRPRPMPKNRFALSGVKPRAGRADIPYLPIVTAISGFRNE
jgi:hypothetical protein